MKAIVAVDQNWGIGYRGSLLQRIPEDMRFFRQMTLQQIVVMGRATFESLPGQEALKDRINIVLSRKEGFRKEKVTVCRSLEELFQELAKHSGQEVFVIGGETVYLDLLPYCSEAFVTKIENSYPADKYFVNLDREEAWKIVSQSESKSYNGVEYRFLKYARIR